jgi:peptidoglycan/LPS O-acetylase OafA/YrhL
MTDTALNTAVDHKTTKVARGSAGDRLPSLTGLRFGAAFLVFGFHLQVAHIFGSGSKADHWLGLTFGHGAVGVSFFFVLSGFVLTWSAKSGERARDVWRRRAARIYPNHLVTAVVAIAGGSAVGGGVTIAAVVANVFLVQSWIPSQTVYFGLNTVAWSLSCEVFFYLAFPFLLRGLDRLTGRGLWPVALGLMAIVWCLPLVTLSWSEPISYWFIYVFPASRLPEFCLGMVLARIVRSGRWIGIPVWAAGVLLVAAYIAVGYIPAQWGYVAVTVVPLALFIPAVAAADVAGRRSFWAMPKMVWLGEISFAFYLVHQLVIRYASKLLHVPAAPPGWGFAHCAAVAVFIGVAALIGAWLLHIWVEKPMVRRLGRSRRPVTATAPVSVPAPASPADAGILPEK